MIFFRVGLEKVITLPSPKVIDIDEIEEVKRVVAVRTPEQVESIANHDQEPYYAIRKVCEENNLAFTGMVNKKPIFAAGMKMIWGQVAEGWVIASSDVWNYPLSVAKAIKKDFARVAKEHNIKRVQTAIRKDFIKGQRFAEWLGLENEGLMKHYGFDGTDQYRYARIF